MSANIPPTKPVEELDTDNVTSTTPLEDTTTPNRRGTAGGGEQSYRQQMMQVWQNMNWMKRIIVGLVLLVVVLLITIIALASKPGASTQSPIHPPATTQPTTTTTQPSTTTGPLTPKEKYEQDKEEAESLQCKPTRVAVIVNLPESDGIRDKILTNITVVTQCRGLCYNGYECFSDHAEDKDFVVAYMADNGTIMYTIRKIQHETQCQCEAP